MFETRIVTEPTPVTRYYNVKCDACRTPLKPAIASLVSEDGGWDSLQAEGALHIQMSGGYGEYVDVFSGSDLENLRTIICKRCAERLMSEQPFLKMAYDKYCMPS